MAEIIDKKGRYVWIYATKESAQKDLAGMGLQADSPCVWSHHGVYCCAHGEHSRPEYVIRKRKEGYYIYKKTYHYAGTYTNDVSRPLSGTEIDYSQQEY